MACWWWRRERHLERLCWADHRMLWCFLCVRGQTTNSVLHSTVMAFFFVFFNIIADQQTQREASCSVLAINRSMFANGRRGRVRRGEENVLLHFFDDTRWEKMIPQNELVVVLNAPPTSCSRRMTFALFRKGAPFVRRFDRAPSNNKRRHATPNG